MAKLWLPGDSRFALSQREPNLLVPGRKPIGPVEIDWSNSDAGRLLYLAFPQQGHLAIDLVGGQNFSWPGGLTGSDKGVVATFNGSQYTNLGVQLRNVADTNTDVVVLACVRRTAAQAGNPGQAFGLFASGSQAGWGVGFDTSGNVGAGYLHASGAGLAARSSGLINEWYTVAVACREPSAQTWLSAWINGVPATTSQDSAITFAVLPAFDEISVGAQHRSSGFLRQFKGDIAWVALLHYPSPGTSAYGFSDSEAARLYRNGFPFNLTRPANSTPFLIGLPGGGGAVAITVPQGNLTLSTAAPTVSVTASASIEVPQADLVLNTTAPTVSVSDHVEITVPHADLTLSTTAPTVQASANVSIEVPQADLSLSSEPPAVTTTDHVEISPPAADLSLSSIAPTIAVSEDGAIIVPTAQLLLSTQAPTVELSNNVEITVPQGDLSLSTTAPQVGISWNIEVPQGALSLSSTAPSVLQGFNILVPGADITLSPTAPTVATTAAVGITVPQGDLSLEGFAPTVEATGVDIWTQVGAVSTSWTEITSSSTVWTEI